MARFWNGGWCVNGPGSVDKPEFDQFKGIFYFIEDDQDDFMDCLWDKIVAGTLHEFLGYYAWYTPDRTAIFVHTAHPQKKELIKGILEKIGVKNVRFYVKKRQRIY